MNLFVKFVLLLHEGGGTRPSSSSVELTFGYFLTAFTKRNSQKYKIRAYNHNFLLREISKKKRYKNMVEVVGKNVGENIYLLKGMQYT